MSEKFDKILEWMETMSGQIGDIHDDLSIIKSDVRRVDTRLAVIESGWETLQASDAAQQRELTDLRIRVERLEDQLGSTAIS